jgi:hypothetical protein
VGNLEDRAKAILNQEQLLKEADERAAAARAAEQRASEAARMANPRRSEALGALRELVAMARKYRVPSFPLHRARAEDTPKWRLTELSAARMVFDHVGSAWVFGAGPIPGYFPAALAVTEDCRIFPFVAGSERRPDGRPRRWPRYLVLNWCGVACRPGQWSAPSLDEKLRVESALPIERFAVDPVDGPDAVHRMSFFRSSMPWAVQQAEIVAAEMISGVHRSPDASVG